MTGGDPRPGGPIMVIGVGNEYRRDDGVGPAVVARLRERHLPGVLLADCDGEAGRLLELWQDARMAVVVDAVRAESPRPGTVHRRSLRHPSLRGRATTSSHAADLGWAVALAEALDRLPSVLLLFGVEVADTSFGVGLSPAVGAAADRLAAEIVQLTVGPAGGRDAAGGGGAAGLRPGRVRRTGAPRRTSRGPG